MPKTSYPDTTIRDDWNARQPAPVTSFGDDVARAGNEPKVGTDAPPNPEFVETSLGAVAPDSDTAKAAADVTIKPAEGETEAAGTEPGDSGATEPAATKSVSRRRNTDD